MVQTIARNIFIKNKGLVFKPILLIFIKPTLIPYNLKGLKKKGCGLMEKDFFQDRTDDRCYRDKVDIGDTVLICQKNMQPYAEQIEDLECIVISEFLTKVPYHPMGLKVLGYDIKTGIYKKGRIVYVVRDGMVVTKNGLIPLHYR